MDSTEVRVHGRQEQSAYNGHFESTCYHPLLLFNRAGDCLAAKLRPGNVHSADGWEELLLPEIDRQQAQGKEVAFRGDAAFAKTELYEGLEAREVKYAIRLPANEILERNITELLRRPLGRPSYSPLVRYKSFLYQAASWRRARRVVAKVEFHFGELFPRVGFIVTNLAADNRAVVRFYNKRGTAEQWIKEGKQAVAMTRLSCHRFRANEVRLWLSVIAYNLGNLWRRLALPKGIANWSLTSLQQRLVKTGERLIKHTRYYWLLLAESHLTRRLFGGMLVKMAALPDGRRTSVGGSFARIGIPTPQTFTYNPDNSLKTLGSITATNDADGNLICWSAACPNFAYDERGHLAQVVEGPFGDVYSYDAFGRRYKLDDGTGNPASYLYEDRNPVQM